MKKKFLALLLVASMVTLLGCKKTSDTNNTSNDVNPSSTVSVSSEPISEPEVIIPEATHVGDFTISGDRLTATGGAYEQDGNLSNGAEPIEWIVLSDEGNKLLLLSSKILDSRSFGDGFGEVTWNDSPVREWLNNDFYNAAFNDSEKAILSDYATTSAEPSLGIEAVTDKVFLLSLEEVKKYLDANEKGPSEKRISMTSEYAKSKGVWTIDETNYKLFGFEADEVPESMIGCGSWWLRDNGKNSKFAMNIGASGNIRLVGHEVSSRFEGIRPAIYISISDN